MPRGRKRIYARPEDRPSHHTNLDRTNTVRGHIRRIIDAYKATHPCIVCGEDDPICLDFDHRDPSQKRFCISVAVAKTRQIAVLVAEIEKCDILCSNCHRKKTKRMGEGGRPRKQLQFGQALRDLFYLTPASNAE